MTRESTWDGSYPDDVPEEEALKRALEMWGKDLHYRLIIRRDLPEVISIEQEIKHAQPDIITSWSSEDYKQNLEYDYVIGKVLERNEKVIAAIVYKNTINMKEGKPHRVTIIEHLVLSPPQKGRDVDFYLLARLLGDRSYVYEHIRIRVNVHDFYMIDILQRAGFNHTRDYPGEKAEDEMWFGRMLPQRK